MKTLAGRRCPLVSDKGGRKSDVTDNPNDSRFEHRIRRDPQQLPRFHEQQTRSLRFATLTHLKADVPTRNCRMRRGLTSTTRRAPSGVLLPLLAAVIVFAGCGGKSGE